MKNKSVIKLIKKDSDKNQTSLDLFTDHISIKIEAITPTVCFPKKAEGKPNAIDLYVNLGILREVEILEGDSYLVNTGVALALPEEIYGEVSIQSISKKTGDISLYKHTKKIPIDEVSKREYGDLMILVHNNTNQPITLRNNHAFAQLVFHPGVTDLYIQRVLDIPVKNHIHFGTI